MKNFVNIQGDRLRKNTIKRLKPIGDTKINVYFNTSRDKRELETYSFNTLKDRDEELALLDDELNF